MRFLYYIAFLCLSPFIAFGQSLTWQWGVSSTGSMSAEGTATAFDSSSGDVYLLGHFESGSITFGTYTLHNPGSSNFFLVKYDTLGNVLWAQSNAAMTSNAQVRANAFATDKTGDVYIKGTYIGGPFNWGGTVFPLSSHSNIFVAKYDGLGNLVWARHSLGAPVSGSGNDNIAVDPNGNVLVTSAFSGDSIRFGNITLYDSAASNSLFVVKYSSNGSALWAKAVKGENASGQAIAADNESNFYITGLFYGPDIGFDSIGLNNNTTSGTGYDYFIAKFDSSGNVLWAKGETGAKLCIGSSIAISSDNNIYVTGQFSGATNFGGLTLSGAGSFVLKYDDTGSIIWGKNSTGDPTAIGYSIRTDLNGNIYTAGGCHNDSIGFDSTIISIPQTVVDPVYVIAFSPDGKTLCASMLASGGDDEMGIATGKNGTGYLSSDFQINPFFIGPDTLHQYDPGIGEDIYLARFKCIHCSTFGPVAINAGTDTICPRDSTQICATQGFSSYAWNPGNATGKCIEARNAGDYYVTVSDNTGCTAESNHITINVYQTPEITISQSGDTLHVYNATNPQWYVNGFLRAGATLNYFIALTPGIYSVSVTDSNGCTSFSQPVIISGIDDINIEDNISIYPNPSVGNWQLEVVGELLGSQAEILDESGRVVYKSQIEKTHSEISAHLAGGVYLLRITSGATTITRKLVKL